MTITRAPSPRYKRPKQPIKISLTGDDRVVLRSLYRHGVMDGATIHSLLPDRSEDNFRRRLRDLYHGHHIDRVDNDRRRAYEREDSLPINYVLDLEGAKALKEEFPSLPLSPQRVRQKNKERKLGRILHDVELSQSVVRLEMAAAARVGCEVIYQDQFTSIPDVDDDPEALFALRRKRNYSDLLCAKVSWEERRGRDLRRITAERRIIPDRVISLRTPLGYRLLFIEFDRGSETILPSKRVYTSPKFWEDSSMLKKLLVYRQAFLDREHVRQFGWPPAGFQVIIETTTPVRSTNMRERLAPFVLDGQGRYVPPALFLFTDRQTIDAAGGDPLSARILNLRGEPVSLIN